jgi:hypothetical protein
MDVHSPSVVQFYLEYGSTRFFRNIIYQQHYKRHIYQASNRRYLFAVYANIPQLQIVDYGVKHMLCVRLYQTDKSIHALCLIQAKYLGLYIKTFNTVPLKTQCGVTVNLFHYPSYSELTWMNP